jgi:hypothetical protein
MDDITAQKLVEILDTFLIKWGAFEDIKKASIYGEAKLAGFILGACFIDAMAGFFAGVDRQTSKFNSGKRFKDFVKQYLPTKYDSEKLWEDLRCGLVHSYAEGGTYTFIHGNKDKHFEKLSSGKVLLNLEDFCDDLYQAYNNFRSDILKDNSIFLNAKYRLDSMGLMGPRQVTEI